MDHWLPDGPARAQQQQQQQQQQQSQFIDLDAHIQDLWPHAGGLPSSVQPASSMMPSTYSAAPAQPAAYASAALRPAAYATAPVQPETLYAAPPAQPGAYVAVALPSVPGHLPPVGSQPPGKPVMVPVEDEEATESEGERPAPGRSAQGPWGHASTSHASQASPSPSVTAPMSAPAAQPAAAVPAAAPRAGSTKGGSKGGSKPRRSGGKGGITLRLLIEEGVLQPGHNVLSVDYKGMKQMAGLLPDGRISSVIGGQTLTFDSPSAFSIYLKRLVNPSRKADDGWKTVRYNNRVLEQYKADLGQRRLGAGGSSGGGSGGTMGHATAAASEQLQQGEPAPKRARVDSDSDLTGGSVAVSAAVKDGDRNVLKLKFARARKPANGAAAVRGVEQAAVPPSAAAFGVQAEEHVEVTGNQRSRPRRQVQAPPRYAALGLDNEHALQPLEAYAPGPPGSAGAQPFSVLVSPAASVVMDAHAHLSMHEVIGVLAGTFDEACRTISVLRAHPVQELATEDNSINVEMDPEDEWRVRQQIEDDGMRVIGWYHSHPTFASQPSTIDIYNQVLQQHHHREEATGVEPYVAAIVGPYDRRLASATSSMTWFYVDHPSGRIPAEGQRPEAAGCVAKALQTQQLVDDGGRAVAEIAAWPVLGLQQLVQRYTGRREAADMTGPWRDGSTRLQKLVASLQSRLPPSQWGAHQLQDLGSRLHDIIASSMGRKLRTPPCVESEDDFEAISSEDE